MEFAPQMEAPGPGKRQLVSPLLFGGRVASCGLDPVALPVTTAPPRRRGPPQPD